MIDLISVKADGIIWYYINKEMCAINTESIHFLYARELWEFTKDKICLEDMQEILPGDDSLTDSIKEKYIIKGIPRDKKGITDDEILECIEDTKNHIQDYFIKFMGGYIIRELVERWETIEKEKLQAIYSWSHFWCIYWYVCVDDMHTKYENPYGPFTKHSSMLWYEEKWFEYSDKYIFDGSYATTAATRHCIIKTTVVNTIELE